MTAAEAHRRLDEALAKLVAEAKRDGEEPPCRAGCAWCCSEPVYAERREAARIAHRVRRMPASDRARVEQAVRDWVTRFMATHLAQQEQPPVMAYRQLRLPCPLLKDNLCSVYEARPAGCRLHIAQGQARGCEDDALRPRQKFLVTAPLMAEVCRPFYLAAHQELDHLVLLLHRELFGEGPRSAALMCIEVEVVAHAGKT